MKPVNRKTNQARRVGAVVLVLLSLHLLLCVYCIAMPGKFIPRNPITRFYQHLILLGPFFTESRILDSHYLSFKYKTGDSWSDVRHVSREHFESYASSPWRSDRLLAISYERYLLRSMHSKSNGYLFQQLENTKPFRELNSFMINEMIKQSVDSIHITYTVDRYLPAAKTFALDTIFTFVYNPMSIAAAKR